MGIEQSLSPGLSSRPMRWLLRRQRTAAPTFDLPRSAWIITAALVTIATFLVLLFEVRPDYSYALFLPPVLASGLMLSGRLMGIALAYCCLAFVLVAFILTPDLTERAATSAIAIGVTAAVVAALDRTWTRSSGISHQVAATLLTDLRQRHEVQTHMPDLPPGWSLDSAVMPAHDEAFCGDVVVGCEVSGVFNAAVLDVSGKGSTAGSRAVLLGGAVSGLLGALEPSRVLPAINDYLVRQGWTDGFATATHVAVDLADGAFSLGSAGHPAAVQFHAGAGRWEAMTTEAGVVLGIIDHLTERDYPRVRGQLLPGDILVLFSDGVVEHKDVDISQGIDRMLGHAEREISSSIMGSAKRICRTARAGETDDRTVVVLRRN